MRKVIAGFIAIVLLSACGSDDESREAAPPPAEGREETRSIRNTESIGYDGAAIADKVDAAITATEERKKRQDEEFDEQTDEE